MSKGTAGRERQTPGAAARGVIKRALAARDVIRRITGRKRAEEALRASEAELSTIYDNVPLVMILVDRDRRVQKVNYTAVKFAQRAVDDMIGRRGGEALRCIHSVDDPRGCGFGPSCEPCPVRRAVVGTFETGKDHYQVEVKLELASREGEVVVLVSTTLLNLPEGQRVLVCIEDITERKRAEEALWERTLDLGERVKELNCLYGIARLVDQPGVSLEEIAEGTAELIPPAWQYPEVTVARIILSGQESRTENFSETPWRQTADITVHGEPAGTVEVCYLEQRPESDEGPFLKEKRSLIDAIVQQLGEAVERKRAEEALRESEETARSIIETALDVFISIDARAVITAWNRQAETTFGWSRREALGRPLPDTIIPPRLRESFKRGVEHFLATGDGPVLNKRIETMAVHRDGHEFPVELTAWAVPSGDGWTFHAFLRDITERKRAEEALRESEETARSIIETALDAFVSIDARAVITAWNPQAETTFGWSRQEAVGRPLPDTIIPPHLREAFKRGLEHFLTTGEGPALNKRLDMMGLHRDGHEFPVELTAWAVPWGDTWTFNAFLRDITERKRAEEEEGPPLRKRKR